MLPAQLGIELESGAAQHHLVRAQSPADCMDGLIERVLSGFRITLRPEEADQPFPACAAASRGSDDGEDCQAPALGRRAEVEGSILLQEEPAKGDESKHYARLAAALQSARKGAVSQSHVKNRRSTVQS
jgi:hypothetical protein